MAGKQGITKIEAVRRALAHLGNDAKPSEMQPWIKKTLGIDMNTDHISTSKGEIIRKAAAASRAGAPDATSRPSAEEQPAAEKPPAPRAAPPKQPAPKSAAPKPPVQRGAARVQTPSGSASGISLQDIQAIKELVERVGPVPLHTLIDLFGK